MSTTKTVSQLDRLGYFAGPTLADASPREPGVWLLPAGAVDAAPPVVAAGFRALWTGAGWALEAVQTPEPTPLPTLAALAAGVLRRMDADVDAIYLAAIGQRGPEYETAEREALAYQAAGFSGEAPDSVTAWSSAIGLTAQAAAESILTQAAQWRVAQRSVRAQRLASKEAARTAVDAEALAAVVAAWAGFVGQMRTALGVDL